MGTGQVFRCHTDRSLTNSSVQQRVYGKNAKNAHQFQPTSIWEERSSFKPTSIWEERSPFKPTSIWEERSPIPTNEYMGRKLTNSNQRVYRKNAHQFQPTSIQEERSPIPTNEYTGRTLTNSSKSLSMPSIGNFPVASSINIAPLQSSKSF